MHTINNSSFSSTTEHINSTLYLKKTTLVLHTVTSNTHQPILVIFGRDVAERVCYQTVICYPTSPD